MTDYFRDRLAAALAANYRIDDELLGGGMSRVFAATEHALGRKVVIKVLPPELSAGVNRERFQREIQVAAQLQHPHVVPLLSAGRIPSPDATPDTTVSGRATADSNDSELLYYTMPFIEGESLRAAVARRGRLPVREVVRILHDVIEALAYAHGRGVVHRDIKPGNILTIGSHALVTDFGVAKALSASMPVSGMTSAGMAIGTPAYMAPEQLAADPAADHRIDIYAVGLLAYELLSGQSPFVGTSPQATMAAQLTRVPDPLDTVRDDVPPALAAIITRCLEKLPENRPQTANALLDALDGVSTPPGGAGSSGAVTARLPAARATSPIQRRAFIAGAMLVVLGGFAVALGMWRRGGAGSAAPVTSVSSAAATAAAPAAGGAAGASVGGAGGSGGSGNAGPRVAGDSAARTPIVLTRAESLAIADAIRKRVTARRDSQVAKGERALADSLSLRFERALSDSLSRIMTALRGGRRIEMRGLDEKEAERFRELAKLARSVPGAMPAVTPPGTTGPRAPTDPNVPPPAVVYRGVVPPNVADAPPVPLPAPGVRRVLLGATRTPSSRREFAGISVAIADSVRRAIGAKPGYDVIDAATLTDPRFYASRSRTALSRAVGAGAVITSLYFPRADSALVLQLQLFDVQKNRITRVLESKPIDVRDPMRSVGDLVAATVAALDEIDWKSVSADSLGPKRP
ncbi:MAG TPA: serine/threonine-protein kinase [Gemmatimonadaceae bacterium]|nr:serine/threonine-protein kinase [Gemmatimonadaceae bacterium]